MIITNDTNDEITLISIDDQSRFLIYSIIYSSLEKQMDSTAFPRFSVLIIFILRGYYCIDQNVVERFDLVPEELFITE